MAPTAPGRSYAPGNGNVMRSASSQQFLLSTRHTYEVKLDVFNGAGLNATTVTKTSMPRIIQIRVMGFTSADISRSIHKTTRTDRLSDVEHR